MESLLSKFILSFLLIALMLIAPISDAQAGGYNLAGLGAKGLAMAGAYRGIADDWSAMYWNPAGLAGQKCVVNVDLKVLYPMVWLTPDMPVPAGYEGYELYNNGVEQTTAANSYPAGSLGLVMGINDQWTAGFSVYAPSALGAEWINLYKGTPYGYNNDVPYPEDAWFSDLKVIDIHPTIAYQVNEDLSLGLGIALQYGDLLLKTPKLLPSDLGAGHAPFPYQHFFIDATLEGTGWGFGFNLGLLYKVTDQLNVGLAFRGPTEIAIEGKVKQLLILPTNPGIVAMDPTKAAFFSGGSLEAEPDGSADFPLPMDFGIGFAYEANDKLTLAFDVLWTQWSSVEDIEIVIDGAGPTGAPSDNSELILRYEDTFKFSVGADYLVCEPKDFHIRLGYYMDPSPIPDGSLRPSITDVADKHNLSFGFTYNIKENLFLEGYYERVFSSERSITEEDMNGDGEMDNIGGKWKMQVDTFGLSIGYLLGGGK